MNYRVSLGVSVACLMVSSVSHAARTYFIDQVINYNSPCNQNDLFDDTTALKSRMDAASWTGVKYIDGDAWAKDFRESCSSNYGSGGLDSTYADTKSFSVFSGHGSPAMLYFGDDNDTCTLNIDNESRLGSMNGATAAVLMYISCETLDLNGSGAPLAGGYEWVRQQLGFHGITGNQTAAYGSFFDDTSAKSNAQAWLDRLSDQPAVALSYINGSGDCWTIDSNAKLKANVYTSARSSGPSCNGGQPLYTWCSRWVN